MKILKFGGSSVATPEAIRQVVAVLQEASAAGPVAVVVSAFGGVTNQLLASAVAAAERDAEYLESWSEIEQRHRQAIEELAPPSEVDALVGELRERCEDLKDLLHGIFLLREASPRTLDAIVAYGERLSSEVVAAALRRADLPARSLDAREVVVTDDNFGRARVDLEVTEERVRRELDASSDLRIITGFTGATPEGQTTTLGRGGSDYTAALVGASVDAEAIELWTDVDGVMTADPRQVGDAFPQEGLSYAELMELSHFGAKVVYPPTIHPARRRGIPLIIKNTFNPSAPGTRVEEESPKNSHPIRGLASIHRVTMMRLEGDGMVGVPGIAMRLFGALARRGVSVILISQSSSEHSICFAVAPEDQAAARGAVEEEFALERRVGMIDELVVEEEQSVLAAVGEEMRRRPGIAGRLFQVLGQRGINVKAIAQGSSELNISLVVERADEPAALRSIHQAFFARPSRPLDVALVGVGRVGGTLLEQIHEVAGRLSQDEAIDLRVVALANHRRMVWDHDGIDLGSWRQLLDQAPAFDPTGWREELFAARESPRVLVDCTASDGMEEIYRAALRQGLGVVAANKRPFVGALDAWRALELEEQQGGGVLFFETTVGAGLPVHSTLRDLQRTGDRVLQVDGVLSGTLNAVLDRLSEARPLSVAVREAHEEGLTEPHPWEDLSGGDVARKLCILARRIGEGLEMSEIEVEPLLPGDGWDGLSLEAFWERLADVDAMFEERRRQADAEGKRLRYLASVKAGLARVALEAVDATHPAHGLTGPDNLVALTTTRYDATPLVVRGPGAGPAVTAAGVLADVLRAEERLVSQRSGR